jgi:hexosaminidase
MWGEYVDATNLQQTVFPRAAAVAERLWSPSSTVDQSDAQRRLLLQRCRMVSRGFQAGPVMPGGYCDLTFV